MDISSITEFGKDWSQSQQILNSLATPVGRRFCQPARYFKNRELSEKWVEIRNKWVKVLQKIDPEITADCLPWDNGRYRYCDLFYRSFSHGSQELIGASRLEQTAPSRGGEISFYLNLSDAVSAMNQYNYSIYQVKRSFIFWDAERQDFDLLCTMR